MPGKEGLETIIELRAKSPQTPILAISGGYATSAPMLAVAKKVGADNVLHKPFEIETLLTAIEKHLGQKKS